MLFHVVLVTVSGMQISLCLFRLSSDDLEHDPCSRYEGKIGTRVLRQRVEGSRVNNPYDPIRYKGDWKNNI